MQGKQTVLDLYKDVPLMQAAQLVSDIGPWEQHSLVMTLFLVAHHALS